MKTFKVGKIYTVRKGNIHTYVYPTTGKNLFRLESDESFLILKQGKRKDEYVVLVLNGNHKEKTGLTYLFYSPHQIVENFNEV